MNDLEKLLSEAPKIYYLDTDVNEIVPEACKPNEYDIPLVLLAYAEKLKAALKMALLFIDVVESSMGALMPLHQGMAAETKTKIAEILQNKT